MNVAHLFHRVSVQYVLHSLAVALWGGHSEVEAVDLDGVHVEHEHFSLLVREPHHRQIAGPTLQAVSGNGVRRWLGNDFFCRA